MGALDGKIAIVTGGTSGIGEGVAEAFVSEGAKVVIAGRREEEGRAVEKRIGVRFVRTDVANEADVKAMVEKTVEWFGRVDCLINNAGIPAPMVSITEVDVATIDQVLAVNVKGVILGIKHVAPVMLAQRSGSIVNIGSMAGHRGGVSGHIYSARSGERADAFGRGGAGGKGRPGQRHLARRDRDRHFRQERGPRGLQGRPGGGGGERGLRELCSRFRARECLRILRKPQCFLRATAPGSSTGQDIVVDGGHTAVTRDGRFRWRGAPRCRSASRRRPRRCRLRLAGRRPLVRRRVALARLFRHIRRMSHDLVLIVDFGSQVTQLIARRVREAGVYCEIHPFSKAAEAFARLNPKAVILSGGPASVPEPGSPRAPLEIFKSGVPILAICYGQQTLCEQLGGKVESGHAAEFGRADVEILAPSALFDGVWRLGGRYPVWMSHGDSVTRLPDGFRVYAVSENAPYAVAADEARRYYSTMFHPEVVHTPDGAKLIANFLFKIAGLKGDWTMARFREEEIARIRAQVGKSRVICGLSGGVDSAVAAC